MKHIITAITCVFITSLSYAQFPKNCQVTGISKVAAKGPFGFPYDKDFNTTFDLTIAVDPGTKIASVNISHKGHTTTLSGKLTTDSLITLNPGQSMPQKIEGDNFNADLNGTLINGTIISKQHIVGMILSAAVKGNVALQFFSVNVEGVVNTDANGVMNR